MIALPCWKGATPGVCAVFGAALLISMPAAFAAPGDVEAFNPSPDNIIYCTAVQPDGKILIGGEFTSIGPTLRSRIARLNPDGTLDTGFNPGADGYVTSLTVQPDGKILVGGGFTVLGGSARVCLGRLFSTGAVDPSFTSALNGSVFCCTVQPDRKLLVGGSFLAVEGVARYYVARLEEDGGLDSGFVPGASAYPGTNNFVRSIALQPDGKVILGGSFSIAGGPTRNGTARLSSNGALDTGYDPNAGGQVASVLLQPDGKILLGGWFTAMSGVTRNRIARLNADTSLDSTFNPNVGPTAGESVMSMVLQADGKIVIGGAFTSVGPTTVNRVCRLTAAGLRDTTFTSGTNALVRSVSLLNDGKVLVGGDFTLAGGAARNGVARLANSAATQELSVLNGSRVQWLRGGAAPESNAVFFDVSTNGGGAWTTLGFGSRIAGGWELTGAPLPSSGLLRASARTSDGMQNGSGGLVQSTLPYSYLTPLQQWKFAELGDANAPDLGDPDFDGLATLVEYVLGTSPATASPPPDAQPFPYSEGTRLRLFFIRDPAKLGAIIDVEAAGSPSGPWTVVATSANGVPTSGPGYVAGDSAGPGLKTVEVRDVVNISDASRRFLRVRASR